MVRERCPGAGRVDWTGAGRHHRSQIGRYSSAPGQLLGEEPGSQEQRGTLLSGVNLQFSDGGSRFPSSCESQLNHSTGRAIFFKHRWTLVLPSLQTFTAFLWHRKVPASPASSSTSSRPPLHTTVLQPHALLSGPQASLFPQSQGLQSVSLDQQHQRPLEICHKYKLSG